ncbi:MAG: zinc ribbon domain-containing protein [Myxococcota bacterium]
MLTLPWIFAALAAGALFVALFQLWESFRAAFGTPEEAELQANVEAESRRLLLERKAAILENLRDLRFDHDAGRIGDDDFAHLETKLRGEAKEVLRLLDADVEPYREAAEALVAARLKDAKVEAPYRSPANPGEEREARGAPESEPESGAPGLAETRKECPSCGTANELDAAFCKSCGHAFEAAAEAGEDAR